MATIKDHISIQVNLKTATAAALSFLQMYLVDDVQIPIDRRYLLSSGDSLEDDFSAGTPPRKYGATFFGQDLIPATLVVARWLSAATAAGFVWGANMEIDFEVWKLISDGEIEFIDTTTPTPNVDQITGCDFLAITALPQVAAVLNAKLAALVAPNITGLELATIVIDSLGRYALQMPAAEAGASKPSVTMRTYGAGVGTDLAPLMDTDNGIVVAPRDAETLTEAVEAVEDIFPAWYIVRPEADVTTYQTQIEDLAAYVQGKEKAGHFVSGVLDSKNPAVTTDLGSKLKALAYNRSMVFYTEKSDEYIQAASAGRCLPVPAGKINWGWNKLRGVSHSGAVDELGKTDTDVLISKNYNVVEALTVGNILYPGLMADGEEMRIIIGRDWFAGSIRNAMAVDQVNNDLMAFDNPTIAIAYKNISTYGREAIARRILVNTPDRPWTITLPDEDDFTAADRATHKMVIDQAFKGYINSAVNDWEIIGTWTL